MEKHRLDAAIAELEQSMGYGNEDGDDLRQAMIELAKKGLIFPEVKNDQLVRRKGRIVWVLAPTLH